MSGDHDSEDMPVRPVKSVCDCVSISWTHSDYACLVYIFRGRSVLKGRLSLPLWTQSDGQYITSAATMTNDDHAPTLPRDSPRFLGPTHCGVKSIPHSHPVSLWDSPLTQHCFTLHQSLPNLTLHAGHPNHSASPCSPLTIRPILESIKA